MTALKAALPTFALALFLAAWTAAPAAAGTPCWKILLNDWYDGRIDATYPIHCYEDAIQHLPPDVVAYSSARDDLQRALLAAIRHDRNEPPSGSRSIGPAGDGPSAAGGTNGEAPKGFISQLIDKIGPKNAESVPLPLLVLAGIALLLLAAAAASFVARKIQARRVVVAPAPVTPPKRR